MRQRDNPFIVKRGSNDLLQRVVRDGREVVAEVDKEDVPAFPVRAVVGDKLLLQPSDAKSVPRPFVLAELSKMNEA